MSRTATRGLLSTLVSCLLVAVGAPGARGADRDGNRGRHGDRHHEACLAPSGTDDTVILQAALERCSGAEGSSGGGWHSGPAWHSGPGRSRSKEPRCEVVLCEGTFHVAPLRVRDFHGALRGAGPDRTVVQALPDLEVNDNPDGFYLDDPFDPQLAPWPFLLQFVGGEGTVRDLAVEIPVPAEAGLRPTRGWLGGLIYELAGAVLITGRTPVDFDVERIRVVAGADPASDLGTTLLAGVYFEGTLFNPDDTGPYPVFPLGGRYEISDSEFVGMISGTPLAELSGARVRVARNRYDRAAFAMDVIDASDSRVSVVRNQWDTWIRGLQVLLNLDGAPSLNNAFVIGDNEGSTGVSGDGVYFQDPFDPEREPGGTTLSVRGNSLALGDPSGPAASGVSVFGAGVLQVVGNRLRGGTGVGLAVDDTTGCGIAGNAFRGLDTRGGPDVELGPGTRECRVVVGPGDTVEDRGQDNQIDRRH
jgi:hypothetical protein